MSAYTDALARKPHERALDTKVCPVCGKTFSRKRYEHISRWERRVTCSHKCSGARRTRSRTDFWKKVQKAGPQDCWEWQGRLLRSGYAQMRINGRDVQVHRFAYQDHYGKDPGELFVCHTCDNRACVNPAHLFLGTNADNMRDMRLKDRGAAKLTPKQVQRIRWRYQAGGVVQRELAQEYGVHQVHISRIVRGTRWRHHK